jgi:hypothetical protein
MASTDISQATSEEEPADFYQEGAGTVISQVLSSEEYVQK